MPVSWLLPLLLADVVGSLSDAPDARLLAAVRSWRKERRLDHETENPSHGGTVLRSGLWGFPWKTRSDTPEVFRGLKPWLLEGPK